MPTRVNTALRNVAVDAIRAVFPAGSTVQIRTGTQPASANTAASGTLLGTITLPADPFAAGVNGSIVKQGSWSTTAGESGIAGYARIIGTTHTIDVSLGTTGTIWIIDNANIVEGGTITVVTGSITFPSGE